jgi:hypothetical protein
MRAANMMSAHHETGFAYGTLVQKQAENVKKVVVGEKSLQLQSWERRGMVMRGKIIHSLTMMVVQVQR